MRGGRGEAGNGRAEAEFLEREGFDFSSGLETFGLLESFHGRDGGFVPFAGRVALIEAFAGQGLLDFLDAGGIGGELAAGFRRGGFLFLGNRFRGR